MHPCQIQSRPSPMQWEGAAPALTLISGPATYDSEGLAIIGGLVSGNTYLWQPGEQDWELDTGSETLNGPGQFVADYSAVHAFGIPGAPYTGRLYLVNWPAPVAFEIGLTDESGNTLKDENGNILIPDSGL